ncbi:YKL047W [Saccharomyces arboricola H-6]|uniref:YKL047W n=1 Tax=Saccharomyces arboricola (strain H-6 / AS 2.3317 / CBS 10644) TaxID=1160507 RepID=J8PL80_SACAR|nr:YKL047W [Saccharomyces arboricola H-6]
MNVGDEEPTICPSEFSISRLLNSNHERPGIACIFLSKFDVKKGNIIVWSKSTSNTTLDLNNIEFKSLPAGIHEQIDDVVNFVVPKRFGDGGAVKSAVYDYGIAYFEQNSFDIIRSDNQIDRSKVQMFSLGIIIDVQSVSSDSKKQFYREIYHAYGANKYASYLKELLGQWISKNDLDNFEIFENFFEENKKEHIADNSIKILEHSSEERRHLVKYLPYWTRKLGPLMFPLWKASLLQRRILILVPQGESFELCNSLAYCVFVLSMLSKDLIGNHVNDEYIEPIFTVSTSDIPFLETFKEGSGYIATTSEEILLYKPELYDIVVKLPSGLIMEESPEKDVEIITANGEQNKATPVDLETYEKVILSELREDVPTSEKNRLHKVTEPISWLQFLIDGFYLLSTAGYLVAPYHMIKNFMIPKRLSSPEHSDSEIQIAENLIRYFHLRTSSLYNMLKDVIQRKENIDSEQPIIITASFLTELNLDRFSMQDHQFIKDIAYKWFERSIDISDLPECVANLC